MASKSKSFRATLERLDNNLGWVIARVPFDPTKAWPERNRLRVRGEIRNLNGDQGFAFRSSLFPLAGGGQGYFVLVNKKMQSAAGVVAGLAAKFTLEPDLEERAAVVPPELNKLLAQNKSFRRWYDALPYSVRKDCGNWVMAPKSAATRQSRAEQLAERLLLTMEGERELPPILQTAFLRSPRARKGWELMTEHQRRGHLMGIFYYKTPEARERRTAKAIEEALRTAEAKRLTQ